MAIACLRLTESGLDDVNDSLACVDVGKDLSAAGRILGTFLEDDDLRLLKKNESKSVTDQVNSGRPNSEASCDFQTRARPWIMNLERAKQVFMFFAAHCCAKRMLVHGARPQDS